MDDNGKSLITLETMALELGVSASTVSRALSDHPGISKSTRAGVKELARRLGYAAPARRRRARIREPQLLVVMPPYANQHLGRIAEPFVIKLLEGITRAMRDRGLDFQISHRVPRDEPSLRQLMEMHPDDGFIFLGQSQFHDALNRQTSLGRALVVWGSQRDEQAYCSIGSDNYHGGFRATTHLLRLGRRRIAFLGTPAYFEILDRLEGYKAALRAHDIDPDEALILSTELDIEDGMVAAEDLLSRGAPFDGVIAATDTLAFGVIKALARHGMRVPQDVSVVGYDDIDSASHSSPALTTVRQDPLKAGRLLTSKLIQCMAGQRPSSERMPAELVIRESCGG